MSKKIFFTVTNDLSYDQRMNRICTSMAKAGYEVVLVGRKLPQSIPLQNQPYKQVRLKCKNTKGKLFYLEYNYRLYRYLMKQKMDAICAIDLDTLLPVYKVSKKKRIPRLYDAHEYFTEMIEVKSRSHIYWVWKNLEKWLVPKFRFGYTVGNAIAGALKNEYGVNYAVVRNVPFLWYPEKEKTKTPETIVRLLQTFNERTDNNLPILLYQGAINQGRALPELLTAMHKVEGRLLLAGTGNMEKEISAMISSQGLEKKIWMCGNVLPADLRHLTMACYAGITIFDALSLNQYYSLGNKFFDYIMANKPQVCVNYPEYAEILKQYPVALPIESTNPDSTAFSLNKLLNDSVLYRDLETNCKAAAEVLNWNCEEKILYACWENLFVGNHPRN